MSLKSPLLVTLLVALATPALAADAQPAPSSIPSAVPSPTAATTTSYAPMLGTPWTPQIRMLRDRRGPDPDHQFFEDLIQLPSPATPPNCDAASFETGYREALTGHAIYEVLLNCEDHSALGCAYQRIAPPRETETARKARQKLLSCCKAGTLAGLGKLHDALRRSGPDRCTHAYEEALQNGRNHCRGQRVCFRDDTVYAGCRSLGYLVGRAKCSTKLNDFLTVHGVSDSSGKAQAAPAAPAHPARAPAGVAGGAH